MQCTKYKLSFHTHGILSTSIYIYDIVLLDVCNFHHQDCCLIFHIVNLSWYSCLYLGSCIQEVLYKKLIECDISFAETKIMYNSRTKSKNSENQLSFHFFGQSPFGQDSERNIILRMTKFLTLYIQSTYLWLEHRYYNPCNHLQTLCQDTICPP